MMIRCGICKYAIKSSKPEAQADILKKATMHLGAVHLDQASELAGALAGFQALAATYLVFSYLEIPPEETALKDAYQQNRDALMQMLESRPLADPPPASSDAVN